jgi:hypothetical protein
VIIACDMLGSEVELPDILARLPFVTVGDLMLHYGIMKSAYYTPLI